MKTEEEKKGKQFSDIHFIPRPSFASCNILETIHWFPSGIQKKLNHKKISSYLKLFLQTNFSHLPVLSLVFYLLSLFLSLTPPPAPAGTPRGTWGGVPVSAGSVGSTYTGRRSLSRCPVTAGTPHEKNAHTLKAGEGGERQWWGRFVSFILTSFPPIMFPLILPVTSGFLETVQPHI